jgi:hypothetical protein
MSEENSQQEEQVQQRAAVVPEQLFGSIMNFVTSKPYAEVSAIIDAVKQEVQIVNLDNGSSEEDTMSGEVVVREQELDA